jgi:predicted RNA-binding protein with EMAP domain
MKKFIFAFSLVLFLTSLGLAGAANQQSGSSDGSSAQKAAKTVSGEVMSVNPAKNELVVKDETGGEVRLLVGKSTKVIKEGKAISLADLKPSEKVICEAEESAGSWTAKSIRVSS